MIRVVCGNCGAAFNAGDAHAGKQTKCPNCQKPLQIPAVPAASALQATPVAPPPKAPPAAVPSPAVAAAPAQQVVYVVEASGNSGLGVAGFVCGLVGLILSFIPCIGWLGFGPAVAGIICSSIALATANKTNKKKGLAIAGLVLSILTILWIPLFLFAILGAAASNASHLH